MTRALLLLSTLLAFLAAPVHAFESGMQSIASGGPFEAKRKRIESFGAKFTVSANQARKPMMLVLHNGFSDRPGFEWLRVFLCGDISTNLDKYEEPQGDLIYDENYVQQTTISLDITDLVREGVNTVYIEAKGRKGSIISWNVNTSVSPSLAPVNPGKTHQGAKMTFVGRGFSHDPQENQVKLDGLELEVTAASRTRLTVRIPADAPVGKGLITITTKGVKSEAIPVEVLPTPQVVSLSKNAGLKRGVDINGNNLKGDVGKVEVFFGNFRAKVIETSPCRITVELPEDLLESGVSAFRVNVTVDGVTAHGSLIYQSVN